MLKKLWDHYWTWRATDGKIIHTLVISRIKLFAGVGYTVLLQSGVDVTSFIHEEKYKAGIQLFMAWLAVDGTLCEWGRRHAADDIGEVPDVPPPPNPPEPPNVASN